MTPMTTVRDMADLLSEGAPYRTPKGRKGKQKQAWMKKYSDLLGGGKIDWDAAHHFYFQKMSPEQAAKKTKA